MVAVWLISTRNKYIKYYFCGNYYVKGLLLINEIKTIWQNEWSNDRYCMVGGLAPYFHLLLPVITRTQICFQIHDGIREDEVGRDVARFSAMRKTYKTLDGKTERKTSHGRRKRRREDNGEIDLEGGGFDEFVCIQLALDGSSGRGLASWKFHDRMSRCIALRCVELLLLFLLLLLLLILLCYLFCWIAKLCNGFLSTSSVDMPVASYLQCWCTLQTFLSFKDREWWCSCDSKSLLSEMNRNGCSIKRSLFRRLKKSLHRAATCC